MNEHFVRRDSLLTPRETQVVLLIVQDLGHKEIAARLNISVKTVDFHVRKIYEKLGVSGPAGIARHAIQMGWIEA
jgi:DNA-binding CsgD family transcriptional regulator